MFRHHTKIQLTRSGNDPSSLGQYYDQKPEDGAILEEVWYAPILGLDGPLARSSVYHPKET